MCMQVRVDMADSPPEREEMNAILREYYELVIGRLVADGGPEMTPGAPIADFWAHLDEFLPPRAVWHWHGPTTAGCWAVALSRTLATVAAR